MLKMAANPVLSEGKQVKSNPSAARKGSQPKKTAARKAPFADFVAGMAAAAGNPGKHPTACSQSSGLTNLRVAAPVFQAQPLAARKAVKENQVAGKPENYQLERPDQAARTAAPESPAVSGKDVIIPGELNRLKPIPEGSLRSKGGDVSSAHTAAGKIGPGEVYSGRRTGNLETPAKTEGGQRPAAARPVFTVQPDQAQDRVGTPTDMVRQRNRAEGGDGQPKPELGPNGTSRDIKPSDTDNGAGSPSSWSSAARMSETAATQTIMTGPDRTGLSQTQIDALMDKMVHLVKSAPASLEVQLKPEYLGNVNILVESRDGAVTIMIAAQNNDTASMLNSNLASMRNYLEQQGINLQQMEVNQGYRENRDQSANQQERGRRPEGDNQVAPDDMKISGNQYASSRKNRPGLNILA